MEYVLVLFVYKQIFYEFIIVLSFFLVRDEFGSNPGELFISYIHDKFNRVFISPLCQITPEGFDKVFYHVFFVSPGQIRNLIRLSAGGTFFIKVCIFLSLVFQLIGFQRVVILLFFLVEHRKVVGNWFLYRIGAQCGGEEGTVWSSPISNIFFFDFLNYWYLSLVIWIDKRQGVAQANFLLLERDPKLYFKTILGLADLLDDGKSSRQLKIFCTFFDSRVITRLLLGDCILV